MSCTTNVTTFSALAMALLMAPFASAEPLNRGDFSPVALATGFEGFPNHTQLSTQYQSLGGIAFTTAGSSPQVNNDFEAQYGPLANGNILATGTSLGSNQIELRFVDPLTGNPAATTGVGADIIFRNTGNTATLEVFDSDMLSLGSVTTGADGGPDDEVFLGIGVGFIHRAVFTFNASDTFAGIDNLIWEPVPEPTALTLAALALAGVVNRRLGVRRLAST